MIHVIQIMVPAVKSDGFLSGVIPRPFVSLLFSKTYCVILMKNVKLLKLDTQIKYVLFHHGQICRLYT